MTDTKNKMQNILLDLKENYHAIGLKCEFEAEGSTLEEAQFLKSLAEDCNLKFALKIGGCEAIKDLREAKELYVDSIIAPMIETPYALKKFVGAINQIYSQEEKSQNKFYINIETITGIQNVENIICAKDFGNIDGVVLGRSDLTSSMNISNTEVDNDNIFEIAKNISVKLLNLKKEFIVGGNVSAKSIPFLKELPYLSKYETRKIIFDSKNIDKKNTANGLIKAFEFELLWLKYKSQKQPNASSSLDLRIKQIEERLTISKSLII